MIKSKIDARERALELAIKFVNGTFSNAEKTLESAKSFSDFLIGDVELPETQSDTELVKAFLEVMNNELEKKCKPNTPDYAEMLRAIKTGNAGISAEMPCKSEAE
jgi:hypothetical protein